MHFQQNIVGEVYEVDDKMLETFDILERHPFIYERDRIIVEVISDEEREDLNNNDLLRDLYDEDSNANQEQAQDTGKSRGNEFPTFWNIDTVVKQSLNSLGFE